MQLLHLPPKSNQDKRIWSVGNEEQRHPEDIVLNVVPDSHESFSALKNVLAQLSNYANVADTIRLKRLEAYINDACPDPTSLDQYTEILSNAVAFSVLRRISRESVYTAELIDLSARTINSILSYIPNCRSVHIFHIDRLDRPSIKVFARAMLLLNNTDSFAWHWHSTSDPSVDIQMSSLFVMSRHALLRYILQMCEPRILRHSGIAPLKSPRLPGRNISILGICAALVVQNYDACFLYCTERNALSEKNGEASEVLRVLALAAVNVGEQDYALSTLQEAENMSVSPATQAHYCYLQGLINAKRRYSSRESDSNYNRGLSILDSATKATEADDIELEKAWLLNGLALNAALEWRHQNLGPSRLSFAFELVQKAFSLVREGQTPSRSYLRFNLIANSAFLLEMRGEYDLACDLLTKAFDMDMPGPEMIQKSFRSAMGYRLGVLKARSGKIEEAAELLSMAAGGEADQEGGFTLDHILRAQGLVAIERGAFAEAASYFERGLSICLTGRLAEGTREHARGLAATFLAERKSDRAREVLETLLRTEQLEIVGGQESINSSELQIVSSSPAPKLPPYIPEIDLEDVPKININRLLSNAPSIDCHGVASWAS